MSRSGDGMRKAVAEQFKARHRRIIGNRFPATIEQLQAIVAQSNVQPTRLSPGSAELPMAMVDGWLCNKSTIGRQMAGWLR